MQRERGDLLRFSQAADRLTRLELRACLRIVAIRMQARLQRRGIDGAGADGIAADTLRDEVRGDGLGEADDRRLGGAVRTAIRRRPTSRSIRA